MPYYYVTRTSPRFHKPTLDEFLFTPDEQVQGSMMNDPTSTTTRKREVLSSKVLGTYDLYLILNRLKDFNKRYDYLRAVPRESLYRSFTVPKKNGNGRRPIDNPCEDLQQAFRELRDILELDGYMYHTGAYAYIKKRSTVKAAARHTENDSYWYAHLDLKNFFGSATLNFVMRMLSMIYPYSEIIKWDEGRDELGKALELAFLRGGLPQGSCVSPTITNIMMIPFDYEMTAALNNYENRKYIYARYADDMKISCKIWFPVWRLEILINNVLAKLGAPFRLNKEKTKYTSRDGENWMLGVMINKDNQITIGWKAKKKFNAMLSNYCMDRKNGRMWDLDDLRSTQGYIAHYKSIEKEDIERIIGKYCQKHHMNIEKCIKDDIRKLTKEMY